MSGFALLGELVAGWLLADLVGGILHWWEDRAAEQRWPVIGRLIVAPNRYHHVDPLAFTRNGFLARNWSTWLAALPLSATWLWALGPSAMWAAATLGGLLANQVHFWAHRSAEAPGWVRILQQTGVIQSAPHHGRHHVGLSARYCILTDLLNPVLDGLRVWERLEAALAGLRMPVNGGAR